MRDYRENGQEDGNYCVGFRDICQMTGESNGTENGTWKGT